MLLMLDRGRLLVLILLTKLLLLLLLLLWLVKCLQVKLRLLDLTVGQSDEL